MQRTDTIVIGGGQAGLAASRCLTELGVDHVVLERGRIAERWRSERWDSLRLVTPRWQSRLPSYWYDGDDPDGFMSSAELVTYLETYARMFAAPVREGVSVERVEPAGDGYHVATDHGAWRARTAIVATGHCAVPATPSCAAALSSDLHQLPATRYRNPGALPPGGVLVVGAAASGAQIAAELARAGREVTLAVGDHTRLPRTYRGRDILWWLDAMGVLARSADSVRDLEASRRQPSWQLAGAIDRRVDLPALQALGVRLVGRIAGARGYRVELAGDPALTAAVADARLRHLLGRIDAFIAAHRITALGPEPPFATLAPAAAPRHLDLRAAGITTVVWATGYARSFPWLRVPGAVAAGELVHDAGIARVPGLYALGFRFQRRRSSSFLDGVGDDARFVTAAIAHYLGHRMAA